MDDKKRILIVDDEVVVTRTLKTYLERTGRYEVEVANQSQEALSTARSFSPNIMLLDVTMPDMDGGEIAAFMEKDEELRNIPVVFLTGIVSPEEVDDIGNMTGNRPVLAKPATGDKIIEYIEKYSA